MKRDIERYTMPEAQMFQEGSKLLRLKVSICTVSPRQEAMRLIGERTNKYLENIIQLISHPQ